MKDERVQYILKTAALFAVYFITARIGLSIGAVNGFATFVWPPTGIALASILVLGYRYWPGIALAAFLVNFITGASPSVAAGIALGNTSEALVGAYLLKAARLRFSLDRAKDVFALIFLAAVISTALSATVGTTSLLAGQAIHSEAYGETWSAWWIGDMLSDLIFAPLLLVWSCTRRFRLSWSQLAEIIVMAGLLVPVGVFVFHGSQETGIEPFSLAFLIFPILIWIALRFGQYGSVTAIFVVSIIAILSTINQTQTSSNNVLSHQLFLLQSFMGVTAATFMTMAAVVAERSVSLRRRHQLQHRNIMLAKQRSQLMRLNRARDEFVAITSHQLRTPATGVKQYLGLVLEGYSDPLTEKQKVILVKANENNERQLRIIDDLLRVAQLDLDKIKLKPKKHDFFKLVTEAAAVLEAKFEQRNQTLTLHEPRETISIKIDAGQMRLVLENLLENASNYSYENTKTDIKLSKTAGGMAKLIIHDHGVGIHPDNFPKLFQKFSRIENPLSNSVSGTGLGLYFSKKIIELHNGQIRVSSTPKQGTVFTILLPMTTKRRPNSVK